MTVQNPGRRNLIFLGLIAIFVTVLTTSIELWAYRSSGDIYLDRSRPGFLPDRDEVEEKDDTDPTYSFPESGSLDSSELNTYLSELEAVIKHLDQLQNPYSDSPLSDESLGIVPASAQEPDEVENAAR